MKKALSIFALLFQLQTGAFAQPVITASSNFVAGTQNTYAEADPLMGTPAAGTNMVWDYSAISWHTGITQQYSPCSTTIFCPNFPGSNLAAFDAPSFTYSYLIADSLRLSFLGDSSFGVSGGYTFLDDPFDFCRYPMKYLDSYVDTYSYHSSMQGIAYDMVGVQYVVADGYGTLMLPGGTFQNVLRLHRTISYYDTAWNPVFTPFDIYDWFAPGVPGYLLTLTSDLSGTYWAQFLLTSPTSTPDLSTASLRIYPAPAVAYVTVEAKERGHLSVHSIEGRLVYSGSVVSGSNSIDCRDWPDGLYKVTLAGDERMFHERILKTGR